LRLDYNRPVRWIYLSPHPDDAVLSCGGLLWEQSRRGERVEIWTLMCGFPPPGPLSAFARQLHDEWGTGTAAETVRLRRAEDRAAADRLGVTARHFDYLDCIYRGGLDGRALYADIFVPPHRAEAGLPAEIAAALGVGLRADDRLVCPLAVGGHVDHVLARTAVERLGRPLDYYADLPYLLRDPQALEAAAAGLEAAFHPVGAPGMAAWLEASAAYASQIGALFGDEETMRAELGAYGESLGGVRLWRRPGDGENLPPRSP
jgi:LmbE family N-acetylglucosaminyl deacetylase